MKKFIKQLLGSPRIGSSAGKTLLFIWLKNDLKNLQGDIGVDLAGGHMLNKKFFFTKKYICVDIDQHRLEEGKKENSDAIVFNCKIQEYMKNNLQEKADVLVCVQTMGTNVSFEHDETIKVINQMYNFLKPGGSMIFNVGSKRKNLDQIEKQINLLLNDKFKFFKIKRYGAFHKTLEKKTSRYIRLILAYLMNFFVPLRTLFGLKKYKIYVFCKKKL